MLDAALDNGCETGDDINEEDSFISEFTLDVSIETSESAEQPVIKHAAINMNISFFIFIPSFAKNDLPCVLQTV